MIISANSGENLISNLNSHNSELQEVNMKVNINKTKKYNNRKKRGETQTTRK